MAKAMTGAKIFENPEGVPRFRKVILVCRSATFSQAYVVSIGKRPSAVRMTNLSPGINSAIS